LYADIYFLGAIPSFNHLVCNYRHWRTRPHWSIIEFEIKDFVSLVVVFAAEAVLLLEAEPYVDRLWLSGRGLRFPHFLSLVGIVDLWSISKCF
jgi:hypothetical protein